MLMTRATNPRNTTHSTDITKPHATAAQAAEIPQLDDEFEEFDFDTDQIVQHYARLAVYIG